MRKLLLAVTLSAVLAGPAISSPLIWTIDDAKPKDEVSIEDAIITFALNVYIRITDLYTRMDALEKKVEMLEAKKTHHYDPEHACELSVDYDPEHTSLRMDPL